MKPSERPDEWWGQDPSVDPCRRCGCPIQGGPLGMSRHVEVVHNGTERGSAS